MSVIIITGGSRGIGKELVKKFSSNENKVYFTYKNNKENADDIISNLIEKDINTTYSAQLDISNSIQVKDFVKDIFEKEGEIDLLINNAGITSDSLFLAMNDDKWNEVINTNLNGTFFMTREVAKYMIKRRKGKIINISSVVASLGNAGQINYSASKAGIEGMTRSFALELAPRNITINSIAPGFVITDMTKLVSKNIEKILEKIPLNRFAEPEEIADFVYSFSKNSSNYITGQTIIIDGGLSL